MHNMQLFYDLLNIAGVMIIGFSALYFLVKGIEFFSNLRWKKP